MFKSQRSQGRCDYFIMNDSQLQAISALAELERVGLAYEPISEAEVKICCPFHEDATPSCNLNVKKNIFKCHTSGCGASGDLISLLAQILKTPRRVMWEDLSTRYAIEDVKVIDSSVVERHHEAIWNAKPFLEQLYNRGLTEKVIRKHRLGFDGQRITIPIYNQNGLVVNVRRYLPGAPGSEKMKNKRGYGKLRLYPFEQLKFDKLVLCGGEVKALVVASRLNKLGYGAVTATAGEGNWDASFNKHFEGKEVWVCYDIDKEGIEGANSVCARLKHDVKWVGRIDLLLDIDKYPKGDVNDFFGPERQSTAAFIKLINATVAWEQQLSFQVIDDDGSVVNLHLNQASCAQYTGKRISVKAVVTAMDTAPYIIPKKIKINCERNQGTCALCPVFSQPADKDGIVTLDLHPESPAILEMVATSKTAQHDAIAEGLRIPSCKVVEFHPVEYFNVEDARLSPQLEISSRAADDIMQPALCIGHGLETNENYQMTGRMYPHPKTQQSIILVSEWTASKDALSTYEPSTDELGAMTIFQPKKWSLDELGEKLDLIYSDLSANVTHIFERQALHFIIDLTYHSVLLFKFDGQLTKGWVETLITGDSSQGKSETILRLMHHYSLGERIECKNATVAGLLGGLQQIGSRWFVTWGIIPMHDKRLVILEEIKGTSTEVIAKLTDMRSSGIAEIPKIEKRRTHARTRLIMISNPRGDRPLSMYNFGVEAVTELIGSPEDVRRFDAILLASAEEIPYEKLNKLQRLRPKVAHTHTRDVCRSLILWAWTREADQVKFTEDAIEVLLIEAARLCSMFTETVPIVDRGSMRFKISRLAIALACRTFSHENFESVLVRACHVQYISRFLEETYSSNVFGYKDFSNAIHVSSELLDPTTLRSRILQTPFPSDFVKQLLYNNEIELRDIQDWCGWDRDDSSTMLSLLVRKHALKRDGRSYRKTPRFIQFLKELLISADLKLHDRPSFIHDEEF